MCKIQLEFNTEAEREAYLNGYELAKKMFKKPQGEWIVSLRDGSYKCTSCGCAVYPNDFLDGDANFCPNCGADMRKR